jgi:hypothetical protein
MKKDNITASVGQIIMVFTLLIFAVACSDSRKKAGEKTASGEKSNPKVETEVSANAKVDVAIVGGPTIAESSCSPDNFLKSFPKFEHQLVADTTKTELCEFYNAKRSQYGQCLINIAAKRCFDGGVSKLGMSFAECMQIPLKTVLKPELKSSEELCVDFQETYLKDKNYPSKSIAVDSYSLEDVKTELILVFSNLPIELEYQKTKSVNEVSVELTSFDEGKDPLATRGLFMVPEDSLDGALIISESSFTSCRYAFPIKTEKASGSCMSKVTLHSNEKSDRKLTLINVSYDENLHYSIRSVSNFSKFKKMPTTGLVTTQSLSAIDMLAVIRTSGNDAVNDSEKGVQIMMALMYEATTSLMSDQPPKEVTPILRRIDDAEELIPERIILPWYPDFKELK